MLRRNNFLVFLALSIGILSCGGNKALLKKQSEASRLLGESYYLEGKYTDALAELIKAEQFYSEDPTLHNDLGLVYKEKGEYEKALFHFKKSLKLKPQYPEVLNNMGTVYSLLERWDEAIACFDGARADLLYKTPYIALNNLGLVYYEKKEYNRSVQLYNEALKATPPFAKVYRAGVHRGLGRTYMAMGNYKEALLSLEEAIKESPKLAAAYYDLGQVYLKLQSFEKALSAFEKVLDLSSDPELIAKTRAAIHELIR
jgi:tetratricopeptide (TPR) repeat protein